MRFLYHTQRRTSVGRTPLEERSARRRDLYLTTHNTHNRHLCPGGIRTHDLRRRAAADLRLRPRGHWDRPGRFGEETNVVLAWNRSTIARLVVHSLQFGSEQSAVW